MPPGIGYPPPLWNPRTVRSAVLGLLDDVEPEVRHLLSPEPPPNQAVPQDRGILAGIARAFAGANDPRLTADQNRAAARDALLQAGFAGLAASGQSGAKLTDVVAAMGMHGHQAGAQARQTRRQQAVAQQLAGAVGPDGEVDRQGLRRMFARAVAAGDSDAARAIATVVNAVEAAERPRATSRRVVELVNPETGKPARYLVDDEGNKQLLGESPESASSSRLLAPRPYVDPETGQTRFGSFNSDTGEFVPIEGALPPAASGSEGERKAAAFLSFIPDEVAYIDSVERAPGRVEQALSDRGVREFTSAEQQRLSLAGMALAEAWLRMTTGAAYNEREFQTAYNMFVPRPGDRKSTLDAKRANRRRLVEMLRTQAGRAAGPGSSPSPGGDVLDGYFDGP